MGNSKKINVKITLEIAESVSKELIKDTILDALKDFTTNLALTLEEEPQKTNIYFDWECGNQQLENGIDH